MTPTKPAAGNTANFQSFLATETVHAPQYELKFDVTFGQLVVAKSYFLIELPSSETCVDASATSEATPVAKVTCLPWTLCDLTPIVTYVLDDNKLHLKITNPKST